MILRNLISGLLLAALISVPLPNPAFAIPTGHHTSHTSNQSHKASTRPKTVHVKSYKKKDGTVVKGHDRSAPRSR
jgi:hypothetical protein